MIDGLTGAHIAKIRGDKQDRMQFGLYLNVVVSAIAVGVLSGLSLFLGTLYTAGGLAAAAKSTAAVVVLTGCCPALGILLGCSVYGLGCLWVGFKVNEFAKQTKLYQNKDSNDSVISPENAFKLCKKATENEKRSYLNAMNYEQLVYIKNELGVEKFLEWMEPIYRWELMKKALRLNPESTEMKIDALILQFTKKTVGTVS